MLRKNEVIQEIIKNQVHLPHICHWDWASLEQWSLSNLEQQLERVNRLTKEYRNGETETE